MGIEICNDINELHPKVRELALKFLEECKKAGLNIKITETYRSIERQDDLYAQGRTRSGNIVTYSPGSSMSSYHQWRLAFDIVHNAKENPYDLNILKKAGAIGDKLGLEWGGNWTSFKDMPHFQYTFGLTINNLRAGKLPPTYTPIPTSSAPPENKQGPLKPAPDKEYDAAIQLLVAKGIITTPSAWLNLTAPNSTYVQMLVMNIGKHLDATVDTYEAGIVRLVKAEIINYPSEWLCKSTFPLENVKQLIKLTAKALSHPS